MAMAPWPHGRHRETSLLTEAPSSLQRSMQVDRGRGPRSHTWGVFAFPWAAPRLGGHSAVRSPRASALQVGFWVLGASAEVTRGVCSRSSLGTQ